MYIMYFLECIYAIENCFCVIIPQNNQIQYAHKLELDDPTYAYRT